MSARRGNSYAKGNKGGGRKSEYRQIYSDQVEILSKLGAIDLEIAEIFAVSEQTINVWKKKHKEFSLALKRGKDLADARVAMRLHERAMGFEHNSEEIKVVSNGAGLGSSVVRVPVRKIYPPDTTAAIFWLKNRQKDKWGDRSEIDITSMEESIIKPMTDKQFRQLVKLLNGA